MCVIFLGYCTRGYSREIEGPHAGCSEVCRLGSMFKLALVHISLTRPLQSVFVCSDRSDLLSVCRPKCYHCNNYDQCTGVLLVQPLDAGGAMLRSTRQRSVDKRKPLTDRLVTGLALLASWVAFYFQLTTRRMYHKWLPVVLLCRTVEAHLQVA